VVSDIVMLVHNQNPGIAFGVFSNSTSPWLAPLLLITSALVIVVLGWLLINGRAGGRLAQAGLALILGGAAGNALDRLIHGGVTDFVEIRLGTFSWPAFNVADSAISIGAALVVVELVFGGQRRSDSAERDRG
jgi:signal peptidase II